MANVRTTFTSDDRDIQKTLEKMHRGMVKLREENKRLGQQSRSQSRNAVAGMKQQVAALVSVQGGLTAVRAGVDFVKQAYAEWRAEMKQTGDAAKKFNRQLIEDLATSGDLLAGGKIREAIEGIDTATKTQGLAAFRGVRGAAPAIAQQRALALTKETAKAGLVFDEKQLEGLGGVAGFIGAGAPKKQAGDVLDLAQAVRADLGDRIAEANTPAFRRATQLLQDEVGLSQEEALATVVESIRTGKLRSGTAGDAFAKLAGDIQKVADPKSDRDRAQNRLAELSPAERFKLVLQDADARKALFGDVNAAKFGALTPQLIGQEAQRLRAAQAQDQFQQDIRAVKAQFPLTVEERTAEIAAEKTAIAFEGRERQRGIVQDELTAELNRRDENFVNRFAARRVQGLRESIADVDDSNDLPDAQTSADLGRQAGGIGRVQLASITLGLSEAFRALVKVGEDTNAILKQNQRGAAAAGGVNRHNE